MNDRWKEYLKLEYVDEFTDYGCYIRGNLVVVRCREAWDRHPRQGMFGSMSCFAVADEARRLVLEQHPEATEALAIPDLVMRLPDGAMGAKTP